MVETRERLAFDTGCYGHFERYDSPQREIHRLVNTPVGPFPDRTNDLELRDSFALLVVPDSFVA
jgi:hypothetical protein